MSAGQDAWHDQPTRPPYVCALTRSSEPSVGPFFQTRLEYLEPFTGDDGETRVKPYAQTLYLSAQAIREACESPGSPITASDPEQIFKDTAYAEALLAINADLAAQLEDARSEIAVLRRHPVAETDLADITDILDARYARKSGPKPKAAE